MSVFGNKNAAARPAISIAVLQAASDQLDEARVESNTVTTHPVENVVIEQETAAGESESLEKEGLTPLQKANKRRIELMAAGEWHVERLDPVERALKNPKSLRAAITAHCYQCAGAGCDPNVRASVRDCAVTSCSLHALRPWQNVKGKSADQMTEDEIASAPLDEEFEDEANAE